MSLNFGIVSSDVTVSSLQSCDSLKFDINRLNGISASILKQLTWLSGLTDEFKLKDLPTATVVSSFDENPSTEAEGCGDGERRKSSNLEGVDDISVEMFHSKASLQRDQSVHSVESLPADTTATTLPPFPQEMIDSARSQKDFIAEVKMSQHPPMGVVLYSKDSQKLLEHESMAIKISSLQFCALKTLNVIMSCNKYAEMLLVPNSDVQSLNAEDNHSNDQRTLGGDEKDKDSALCKNEKELKLAMQQLMKHVVKRSVLPIPFERLVTLSEIERAHCMLYKLNGEAMTNMKWRHETSEG